MNSTVAFFKESHVRWAAAAFLTLTLAVAVTTPNLLRSRMAAEKWAIAGSAVRTAQAVKSDHKTVQTGSMELIVISPAEASDRIRQLAQQAGGFVMSADTSETGPESIASVAISIPAERFEDVRGQIHGLGVRVEREKLEGNDVTRQYVDESARLRNLKAREVQYLSLMKQAKTIKTLSKLAKSWIL